ncbi:apoptosis-inducing factor 2 [Marchantia polymorpha subsp. ruderalis]|uniref:FAD/NAD(P)-binding domain-containing protein n=2 Tax=Marchantia polymorpha TaxID=3197 RepID=A0AAF6B495_MARPO|nr:hypothetical protein MARPO_0121s0004 [Marchantia polymorpha]BBN06829.1 hypothetical protein Mp_3g24240 [Marchantia polymorpha subsp. ruderalis]|eukprot:PTQ30650.1 hypothetical protein MARPO_0121s0004 [Marchantia polymorpha]
MAAAKKKVVVVGGGVAGSLLAHGLENDADVTLVDPKDFFEVPYSQLRSTVEPSFADRSLVLHTDYLKKAKFVQASAVKATESELTTDTGEIIPFDFLVVTTGTTFRGVKTKAERLQQFEADHKKIVESQNILIIGGGPVGVELAGEILQDFPKKKVTLIHSGDRLIQFLGPKASEKAEKWLKTKGAEVILNDRVEIEGLAPPTYVTKGQKQIKADAHFVAVGKKLGSDWLLESPILKDKVTNEGRLQVEGTCLVTGLTNVFAAGDITDFKEIKQGFTAANHVATIISNIKKLTKNPADKKLVVYKALEKPFGIVSLGRVDAVAQLPFATIIGWVPGKLKSKDLFVGKARGDLGIKAK